MTPYTSSDRDPALDPLLGVYARRLQRSEAARAEAEALLERHTKALARTNRELRQRELELMSRLEADNRHLLRAQETAAIASFYMDRGNTPVLSAQFYAITGLSPSDHFEPDAMLHLVHPLDRTRILLASQTFFASASPGIDHRYEHRLLRPDGELRWLRWHIRIDRTEQGRFHSVYGTVQDVTETRATKRRARALALIADRRLLQLSRVTEDLRNANAKADRAHRAHNRFLAMISHDIRTPLNGLLGLVDMLTAAELQAPVKRKVDMMRTAGEQLRLLVGDIIDIADLDDDGVRLEPEPVRLAGIMAELGDLWPMRRPAQPLRWEIDPAVPEIILVDPRRLRQIFEALLGDVADGQISLTASRHDSVLRIDIACPAMGDGRMAGYGTVIAQRLIAAMNGRLDGNDSGASWFELPLIETTLQAHPRADSGQLTIAGRPPHVLVVEDIETNRIVLCSLLERLGCTHAMAVNGAEAVTAIAAGSFDAVLMDVMMPVMDGAEATRIVRARSDAAAAVPIIGITAHGLQAERDRLIALGMNACLTKPVAPDALRDVLAAVLVPQKPPRSVIDRNVFVSAFQPLPPARRQALFDLVLRDCQDLAAQLAAAKAQDDVEAQRRSAHSLKGVAGNFGATALLAALANPGDPDGVLAAAAAFIDEAPRAFQDAGLTA